MAGLISAQSRLSFHTLTATGSTFTVPLQEDFTIQGTTMSWTINDLALSEIGVAESDNKAYIRIGNNINEFSFGGGATGPQGSTGPSGPTGSQGPQGATGPAGSGVTQSWAQTLAINNNSQTYNVIMGTATTISSANGGSFIAMDYASTPTALWLDANSTTEDNYIELYENGILLNSNTNDFATASFIQMGPPQIDVVTQEYRLWPTIQGFGGNGISEKAERITSTNSTPLNISTFVGCDSLNIGIEVEATIFGRYGFTSSYGSKMYAVFKYNGATTTQVNTTDKVEKTEFSTATSDIITDGTNIYITVTGETSKSIEWSSFYIKYNITT